MKLNAVGRDAFLTFEVIKEPDTGNLHWHIGALKGRRRREHCVELSASMGDAGGKGTAGTDTTRIRDLRDHRTSGAIHKDHVVVSVKRARIFHKRRTQNPRSGFSGLDSIVVGQRAGGRQTCQRCDRRRSCRAKVDQIYIRISAGLNRPALARALCESPAGKENQEGDTDR